MARASKETREFGQALVRAMKSMAGFSDSAETAATKAKKFGDKAGKASRKVGGLGSATGGLIKAFTKATAAGAAMAAVGAVGKVTGISRLKDDAVVPLERAFAATESRVAEIRRFGGDVSEEGIQDLFKRETEKARRERSAYGDVMDAARKSDIWGQVFENVKPNKVMEMATDIFS
jgi:hypothetical protein